MTFLIYSYLVTLVISLTIVNIQIFVIKDEDYTWMDFIGFNVWGIFPIANFVFLALLIVWHISRSYFLQEVLEKLNSPIHKKSSQA